jgi:hypothetical protein
MKSESKVSPMISLATAKQLKEAGLEWVPANGDQFVIPDRDMDDHVFVINDMATMVELLKGMPVVTFHGTPEWALDYLFLVEAVWLPGEAYLRDMLRQMLEKEGNTVFDLIYVEGEYTFRCEWRGQGAAFHAADATEAYAAALLHLLSSD